MKEADSQFKELEAQAAELSAHSEKRVKELEKELADVAQEKVHLLTTGLLSFVSVAFHTHCNWRQLARACHPQHVCLTA